LKTSAGTGIAVPVGQTAFLFCDGTNVLACVTTIVDGNISGNLTVGGNTTLGDATSDTITATARFNTDLVPSTDNARDLGSSGNSWKDLYIDGTAYLALVDINGGTIDGVSIGATTAATIVNVDNMRLDGNTLSSIDTNGNIVIAPNGTGDVQLDADTVRIGDSGATATLTTNGAGNLVLSTNSGTTSGTIVIANGANGDVTLTPDGTGDVIVSADRTQFGDLNTDAILTTNGTGNLNLTTNNGTNSGTIQIAQGVNGAITLTPNGTGVVAVPTIGVTGGTVNGVGYLNASKVLTTGSALTYNGTNLGLDAGGGTGPAYLEVSQRSRFGYDGTNVFISDAGTGKDIVFTRITEQMRLTSTGLGIGTSSPSRKLALAVAPGASADDGLVIAASGNETILTRTGASYTYRGVPANAGMLYTNSPMAFLADSATSITFHNDGGERMRLDASGNLGLGVTPSAWNAGSYKVFQAGIASFVGGATGAYLIQDNAYSDNTGATWKYINSGYAAAQYYANSGSHIWRTAPSGTAGNAITFTQAMTLDASGNLLVGTTSAGTGTGVSLYGNGRLIVRGDNQNTANTVQNSITNSNSNNIDLIEFNVGQFQKTCIYVRNSGAAVGDTVSHIVFQYGVTPTVAGSITSVGTTTAYNTSSDYRLKNVTGPITNSGDYIDSLKPVEGTWKSNGSPFVGLIAHEVQEVSRTQVATGAKDGEQMQGMDYSSSEIIANLIAEVQSLRTRIAALESK
jgi:hypothetical protein